MKIGIIGGGFQGLVLGHLLSPNHSVTIFEKDSAIGGLLKMVDFGEFKIDKYYHHIFFRDWFTIGLFRKLGIEQEIDWLKSTTSVYIKGRFLPFFKPNELIKFPYLSFSSKIRLGLAILFLQNYRPGGKMNNLNARAWIKRVMGRQVWEIIWQPLFKGKFDHFADEISLSWFWARIFSKRGDKPGKDELLGYPRGGFEALTNKLEESVKANGGKILVEQRVIEIIIANNQAVGVKTASGSHDFDLIICTVAPPIFQGLLPGECHDFKNELKRVEYLGAISTILILNDKLTPAYWNNILEPAVPFKGIIEQTNLNDVSSYGGKHVIYLSRYTPRDSKYFMSADDELMKLYRPHLLKIDKDFDKKLLSFKVYKDDYCQPVIRMGYPQALIDFRTSINRLYQLSMAQIFPQDRGLNAAAKAAEELSAMLNKEEPMLKKRDWNEQMYLAHPTRKVYEHKNFLVRFIENQRLKKVLSLAQIKKSDKVIEVGCEGGYLLKRLLGAKEVVGLDIAQNALDDAKEMINSPKLKLVRADAAEIPFPANYFDKVICSETLEHVAEPKKIIKELSRIVKPDGRVIISVPYEKSLAGFKALLVKLRIFDALFSGIENKTSAWHLQNFNKKEIVKLCKEFLIVENVRLTPFPFLGPRIILKCRKSYESPLN